MIQRYQMQFTIAQMLRWLGVSSSGYYDFVGRQSMPNKYADMDAQIQQLFAGERRRAGAPRITQRLHRSGFGMNQKTVAKRMRVMGLRARAAKKFKVTTDSRHTLPVAPNLLLRDFMAVAPNQSWVSDITYVWTEEGWLYLAVIMDLCSRAIVGWAMSDRITTDLVCEALEMAWWRRMKPNGVIVHSDRGSQYCSKEYQQRLRDFGLICSMSRRGDCYDNAAMESWNHSLKVEAIHGECFKTRAAAKAEIFDYIEVYYNQLRLHSLLNYQSPMEFENIQFA
jgi:putative transposase